MPRVAVRAAPPTDTTLIPPYPSAPRSRARRRTLPWIVGSLGCLLALSAVLRGTRGEAEARRSLMLREGELLGFLARDLSTPNDRGGATAGGAADAAPAWRDVLAALEGASALDRSGAPRLPSIHKDARLAGSLSTALGARGFTPFNRPDEIVTDPWSRRAAIFASLLANGCANATERGAWLDAAVALAADLRSVGTLAGAGAAAALEESAARRLQRDGPLPAADVQRLVERLRAAQRRLPSSECVALRETRALQATVCALADVAPLTGAALRSENEPPVALLSADEAVTRLDRLPDFLGPLLSDESLPRAATDWSDFVDDFARRLPRLATLLPSTEAIAAGASAPARLDHLLALLGARPLGETAR